MLNGLDLFSGIGGMSEALSPWVRTIAYCENNGASQDMLLSRMHRGEIHAGPIWDDVRSLRGRNLPRIDIVFGGFPCQDISLAGAREGLGGSRSGLFYEVVRIVEETKPAFVFLENVWPGVRKHVEAIRSPFESLGFRVRDGHLAASDVGARHKRERWFMLAANPNRIVERIQPGWRSGQSWKEALLVGNNVEPRNPTDTDSLSEELRPTEEWRNHPFDLRLVEGNTWDDRAAFFLRVDNGLPYRCHRRRALGSSVPPIQYREAFKRLIGIK